MLYALIALQLATAGALPIGAPVSGPGYRGVVLSCSVVSSAPECWQPTTDDVARLEAALTRVARLPRPRGLGGISHPPLEYIRQYVGWQHQSTRFIIVTGYHRSTPTVTGGQWLKAVVVVNGGGGMYFSGRYLPKTDQFTELSINGPK